MKTTRPKSKRNYRKMAVLIAAIVVPLLVGGASYAYWTFQRSTPDNQVEPQTDTQEDQGSDRGDSGNLPEKNDGTTTDGTDNDIDDTPDGSTDSTLIEKPLITRATNTNGSVKVVVTFQEASAGTCKFVFSKDDQTLSRDSSIVVGPSYYTCSLSITASSFPTSGKWSVTVIHQSEGLTRSSDSASVEL